MAKILDKQRYKCAMSAMSTVQAIEGAIPILHSGPGCAQKLSNSAGNSGHYSPNIFPCTSINERDVVFGGEKKLRSTIANALKIIDADLFVVLTGCTAEIVGDTVEEVVDEFQDAEKPVLFASTPGFKGNNYRGHEWVIDAIIDQYLAPVADEEKDPHLVNVWADVPYQDEFWAGNYRALERLLRAIGLTPNVIFGIHRGIKNIEAIPRAGFNLLVSPWVGLENVQRMEEKFGTPFLHWPTLPIGAFETSKFLRAVSAFANLDTAVVERYIAERESEYYAYIERFADIFLETRAMSRRFSVVADAQYALAITKFLVNDLGRLPARQYIVDDTPQEYQAAIRGYFKDLNYHIEADVAFTVDGYEIHEDIRHTDYHGYPLILGSYWEKELAQELDAHFLNVSWPVNERLVINGFYAGYAGGLRLLEDIYSVVRTRFN